MEHISTKSIAPLRIAATDTLSVRYTDLDGNERLLDAMIFDEHVIVDTISFYKITNEFEMKNGICAVLGQKA